MSTQLRISDINPGGISLHGHLALAPLNARMAGGGNNEIEFAEPPAFELTIFGTPQGAEASGAICTRYRQPCSRCVKVIDCESTRDLKFILKPRSSVPEGVNPDNDVFVIYFEGDYVDFEDVLQEAVILGLSPFLLPERLPDGSCSACGLKVQSEFSFGKEGEDEKRTLGALLEKARSKSH